MAGKSQIERALEIVNPFLAKCAFAKSDEIEAEADPRVIERVELRMLISGQPNQSLQSFYLAPDTDIEALAEEIVDYAQKDSESYQNPNRYCVVAYLQGSPTEYDSRSPVFTMRGMAIALESNVGPDDIIESDPPTNKGLLSQLMRHNEALQRGFAGAMANIVQAYREELHHERSMRMRTQEMYFETVKTYEELATEKHVRELEAKREDAKLEAQKQMFEDFRPLVPALLNALRGKRILPESITPSDDALLKFWHSLSESQRNAIFSTLKPGQLATVQTLLDQAMKTAKVLEEKNKPAKSAN